MSVDPAVLAEDIVMAFLLGDSWSEFDEEELFSSVFKLSSLLEDCRIRFLGEILAASLRIESRSSIDILQENLLTAWRLDARKEQFSIWGERSTAQVYIRLVRSLSDPQLEALINWQELLVEAAVNDVWGHEPAMERITVLYWLEAVKRGRQKSHAKRR